jgi:hypothetical protein
MGKVSSSATPYKYTCATCLRPFKTVKARSNHYSHNRDHRKQRVVQTQEASIPVQGELTDILLKLLI